MSLATLDRKAEKFHLPTVRWSEARWLSPLVLLVLWELCSRAGVIPKRANSALREIFRWIARGTRT